MEVGPRAWPCGMPFKVHKCTLKGIEWQMDATSVPKTSAGYRMAAHVLAGLNYLSLVVEHDRWLVDSSAGRRCFGDGCMRTAAY